MKLLILVYRLEIKIELSRIVIKLVRLGVSDRLSDVG